MRKRLGVFCIAAGICCLLAAAGLLLFNRWSEANAADTSQTMLQSVQQQIADPAPTPNAPQSAPAEMPTGTVNGYECIGILSIPVLELELPVLTDWSYAKLKVAPCLYYGSYYGTDFVIAAHNYRSHFGRLNQLQPGDLVLFTDMSGTVHGYQVVLLETLPANATEAMITSGFDLSLYTCTPGGGSRVTVRCSAVKEMP